MDQEQVEADGSNSDKHTKAQEFKNSGNDKFNVYNYKGAIADYRKGLLHDPNNSDLHANLAAAYIQLEKYNDAEHYAVFAIHLKPNFYKGYMRAAKAAHGKGVTRLALKRLEEGLKKVTDPNGVKELMRLKNQYIAYLSLKRNAEQELDFDSDRYHSEDEDNERHSDEDEDPEDEQPPVLMPIVQSLPPNAPPINLTQTLEDLMARQKSQEAVLAKMKGGEPSASPPAKVERAKYFYDVKTPPLPTSYFPERKSSVAGKDVARVQQDEPKQTAVRPKSTDKGLGLDKKDGRSDFPMTEFLRDLTKDPDLKKHVAEFKDHLKSGSEAFLSGNYRKAVESYKAARERVGIKFTDYEIDDRLYHVIKYAHCAALISLGTYDEITKAIQILTEMDVYKFSIPALYIQVARAYYKLNRFKAALEPLEKLQELLDNCPIFPTFTWPETSETIQETTPSGLKNASKELGQMCRMSHKPTAVCRFDNCLQTSTHILPSDVIYNSDPDFIGFVRMSCEEKCHIEFHISCWKSYKESICGIGKINDKDFLGRRCLTTDCVNSEGEPSLITIIEIIDSDGKVKSTNKLDPKTTVDSKKAKKKKVKLDDKENKEKAVKPKKPKEKKTREVKKPVVVEEEEEVLEPVKVFIDPVKALQSRKQSLVELRSLNFGLDDNYWDPKTSFFGRSGETVKAMSAQFLDQVTDEAAVRDAKEFLFSYFLTILKDEGPLKQSEVEDLWKNSAGDFCDITVVLPNLKSMCELLTESNRFCQLEDYICLAEQLEEAYATVKIEVSETVNFLMTGSASTAEEGQQVLTTPQHNLATFLTSEEESESEDDDSEDSDEDPSDEEEEEEENTTQAVPNADVQHLNADVQHSNAEVPSTPVVEEMPTIDPPKPLEEGKFSLQEMLNEMTRVKSFFMKVSEEPEPGEKILEPGEKTEDLDASKDKTLDSTSTDTFDTAHGSSLNSTDDAKNGNITDRGLSESSNDEPEGGIISQNDEHASCNIDAEVNAATDKPEQSSISDLESVETIKGTSDEEERTIRLEEVTVEAEEVTVCDADSSGTAKATQIEVATKERQIQTQPKETKDRLSQTKESDLYKELVNELQTLRVNVKDLTQDNCVLNQRKEALEEQTKKMKSEHEEMLARLKEENRKNLTAQKTQQTQIKAEFQKKEQAFKQKEQEISANVSKLESMYATLLLDHTQLKDEMNALLQDRAEDRKLLTSTLSNIEQLKANRQALEKTMMLRSQQSQLAQLHTIRAFWDSQISLLRKRSVEKITELQSWFSMFPSKEVEDLPSWGFIQNNFKQWSEITKRVQQIESNFQMKYTMLEGKIAQGEEVELSTLILPTLPEEPTPLPLDQMHREITEKHVKKIGELTQLVVNQQLEIEKAKGANQQFQQLMETFQMGMPGMPRMQTPMTTAFGGLALQYPYPSSMPTPYAQSSVSNAPPLNQDAAQAGSASKLLQADVQTLLQESLKSAQYTNAAPGKQTDKDEVMPARVQTPPMSSSAFTSSFSFMNPPPPVIPSAPGAPPPVTMPPINLPPPPVNAALNVLKASTEKKETKPVERSSTPKLDSVSYIPSRESTPVPSVATTPTPEKSKKKKKTRSESREAVEVRMSTPVNVDSSTSNHEDPKDDDFDGWNVVSGKPVNPKYLVQVPFPLTDTKLKNKKKLLDLLQLKFPTTTLKDLDDVVKMVREQNNGSLSGLPFEEIETRVERFLAKRHFQKTSTMGLVKFSEAAWGTVKQQETVTWNSLQLEECTICLELMGNDRTRVECNHEFHTKCLRKWLKEKSVCPLCNKFTTMPDEFPAL